MSDRRLVAAYEAWDRWASSKKKANFTGREGRVEAARLTSEMVRVADEIGISHTVLQDRISAHRRDGSSIPDAITKAIAE